MLRRAQLECAHRNYAGVESICREVIERNPENREAHELLNRVFRELGIEGEGHAETPPTDRGYLVIQAWGFGFWSDVGHVLAAHLLAEITGRTPIVHWGRRSLFATTDGSDAFRAFFEPASALTVEQLAAQEPGPVYPPKWIGRLGDDAGVARDVCGAAHGALHFLSRPERVVVSDYYLGVRDLVPWIPRRHRLFGRPLAAVWRDLAERYLRPRTDILVEANEFLRRTLGPRRPACAVHLRGSDKRREDPELQRVHRELHAECENLPPAWTMFVLTDDARLLAEAKTRYGDRVLVTEAQRTDSDTGIHYQGSEDRLRLGREVLIDALVAVRCERFLGGGSSNVAAMIALLRNWPPGTCQLIGESILTQRHLFIHLPKR